MEKPVHTLSFSMSYPQYRDYYLYQSSIAKNRPVWLVPELFLGADVLGAVASLLFRRMAPVGFLPGFPLATEMVSLICVAAYFIVRLGWLFRIRRKARRQYRLKRLGKQKSQIRLYQDFVTVHYPSAAFDSFYEEISSIDRTQRLTVLRFQNGARAPIPSGEWTPQIAAFFMEKMKNNGLGQDI